MSTLSPFSTVADLKKLLQNKAVSSAEICDFYKARIEKYNPSINAVIEVFDQYPKPDVPFWSDKFLDGIPGLIKDNICIKGKVTSAGSKTLLNHRPVYDASVIERICSAGGIILGRANQDEFAMGATGEYSVYGPSRNPWALDRTPGGSGSGSAAAVAAGLAPWTLSTETGGSNRQPAAFCGLVGMYPTYGLVPRYGLIAFASSQDQCGPITRTVYDNALLMSALAGHDWRDSTSLPEPRIDYTKELTGEFPPGTKIGVLRECFDSKGINFDSAKGIDPEIRLAFEKNIKLLQSAGVEIHELDLPNFKYANAVYFVITRAEAASNLSRIDGTLVGARVESASCVEDTYLGTREAFLEEVKRRIMTGNYVLSASHRSIYQQALAAKAAISMELESAFKEVDFIFTPTTASLPFKLGETKGDPLIAYMNDYFSLPTNVSGMPGISVPVGLSKEGLPIGMQFLGPKLSEVGLFRVADAFEKLVDFSAHPMGFQ